VGFGFEGSLSSAIRRKRSTKTVSSRAGAWQCHLKATGRIKSGEGSAANGIVPLTLGCCTTTTGLTLAIELHGRGSSLKKTT